MNRFVVWSSSVICTLALLFVFAGCGSSSNRTLLLISSGTASVATVNIGGSGDLSMSGTTFPTGSDPQVIVIDSQRRYVYVLNNSGVSTKGGVLQYTVDTGKGTLTVVQAPDKSSGIVGPVAPIPTGIRPLSMVIDGSASFVFVANATSNSISVFSVDQTTGALTEVSGSPFPTGTTPVSLAVGGGSLFVANQGAGTVSAYAYDSKTGALTLTGTPAKVGANTTAIATDSNGKVVYVADGTANTIITLTASTSGLTATSTSVSSGTAPSYLHLDPSSKYLYATNAGSNDVSAFSVDGSGGLSAVSGSPFAAGTAPVFLTWSNSGNYVFVANKGSGSVSSFTTNGGSLTPVSGSPFATAGYPYPNGLASIY